jgi:uncharacterized protein
LIRRALLDTNVLISLALAPRPGGTIRNPVDAAVWRGVDLLVAQETVDELRSAVATKPSLRRRFSPDGINAFVTELGHLADLIPPLDRPAPARCRDPRDDYLLEQAIRFDADVLVTGDDDLLSLEHPPVGLRILDPRTFLAILAASD